MYHTKTRHHTRLQPHKICPKDPTYHLYSHRPAKVKVEQEAASSKIEVVTDRYMVLLPICMLQHVQQKKWQHSRFPTQKYCPQYYIKDGNSHMLLFTRQRVMRLVKIIYPEFSGRSNTRKNRKSGPEVIHGRRRDAINHNSFDINYGIQDDM